jgi:hypothetical protein
MIEEHLNQEDYDEGSYSAPSYLRNFIGLDDREGITGDTSTDFIIS